MVEQSTHRFESYALRQQPTIPPPMDGDRFPKPVRAGSNPVGGTRRLDGWI